MRVLSIDVGMTNLGTCIVRYEKDQSFPFVIEQWEKINLKAKKTSQAVKSMIKVFMSRPEYYTVDHVIIESQAKSVSKMKRLSSAMESHFETVRILQNRRYNTDPSSDPDCSGSGQG